jgi:hypothetical protein
MQTLPVHAARLARRSLVPFACACGLLLGCSVGPVRPMSSADSLTTDQALDRMQGRWRSTDDDRSVVEIDGDRVTSSYDGEVMDEGTLGFVESCPEGGEGLGFVIGGETGEGLCYYLVEVDEDRLEYSYAARGNTLAYRRIE